MRILNFLRGKDDRSWIAPKVVLLDIKNEKLIKGRHPLDFLHFLPTTLSCIDGSPYIWIRGQ